MKTLSIHKVWNGLMVVIMLLVSISPYFSKKAMAQTGTEPELAARLQVADSGKMLPPTTPRLQPTGPGAFSAAKPLSPRFVPVPDHLEVPEQFKNHSTADMATHEQLPLENDQDQEDAYLPNLYIYQPYGWDGPVILTPFTETTYNGPLTENQDVYIDWSTANGGADISEVYTTCLFLDNVAFSCVDDNNFPSGYYWPNYDLLMQIYPSAGWHTITLYADVYDDIAEGNETDNGWTAEFYWNTDTSGSLPNLTPTAIDGLWAEPLIISDQFDASSSGGLIAGHPFYVSWAVSNEGPGDAEGWFTMRVDIDGSPVHYFSWSDGLPANYYLYLTNGLVETEISEGWHEVTLNADIDLEIEETDEWDNSWSTYLYWEAPAKANLTPYSPDGWSAPLVLTSTPGVDGSAQLFADQDTYFHFAYANLGSVNASQFYVNLLVDDEFIFYYLMDLDAGYYHGYTDFLVSPGEISSGWHTVKLWLDDTAVIDEYDETDNIYEVQYYWESSSQPNLHPFQPDGWEDALIVSTTPGAFESEVLTANQPVYIDWAVVNDGWGDVLEGSVFRTAIFVDGSLLDKWDYDGGLPSGWYLYLEDYETVFSAGWHFLELKTDTANSVGETSEEDNNIGFWVYVEEAVSSPEIRVEPTEIYQEMPNSTTPHAGDPETLWRNPAQILPSDPSQHGLGTMITAPTRLTLPDIPLASYNAESLPTVIDHSNKIPPVGNQGSAGSCVAWATSYYYKSFQEGLDHGWDLSDPAHQFSPSFVWNQIQLSEGCGGTRPADAYQLVTEKGDVPLSSMPYTADCHVMPDQAQLDLAADYRAENYGTFFDYNAPPTDQAIQDMKAWLSSGDLIQISIPVYEEFDNPSGPYCMVEGANRGSYRGGHAITIVGYDDNIGGLGKKGFKIVNSWGPEWACDGFAYLSYDWVKANAWEAWWMRDIRTGSSTFRDFTIHNDGKGSLIISEIAKLSDSTWLQIALPEALPVIIEPGQAMTVQIAFNPAGIVNGSKAETIIIRSDDANEPETRVEVTMLVGAALTAAPPMPANPQPANQSEDQPTGGWNLSWTTASTSSETMFDVRLDVKNPPATVICNDTTSGNCPVQGLQPNTHYFWRVVSQTPMNATLGPVWEFTTGEKTSPPATGVKIFIPLVRR